MPYIGAFGRGLAKGAHDQRVGWQQLVDHLEQQPEASYNFAVFGGFIEEADSVDTALAQELLDQCAQHPELRKVLVGLHPRREFTETDFDRCMALLDDPDTHPRIYESILWRDTHTNLPRGRILDLAQRLLSKLDGDNVVLRALSMKLRGNEKAVDTLGSDLRRVGLESAIQRLQREYKDPGGSLDFDMERVVSAALRFDGNEDKKVEWLDAIFKVVDENYGYINEFENAIETTVAVMPEAFLNRVFGADEEELSWRIFFIRHGGLRRSPLAKIDEDILIEWCQTRNDPQVWASVASGIKIWSKVGDQSVVKMSETAIRLLEAAPKPEAILEAFAERVAPSSWSGSRASVMQPRANAIGELVEHESAEIAMAAKAVASRVAKWIEREKVDEQREDEEREQRFE